MALIEIIQKIRLVKSKHRIDDVPAPSGVVIRMHGHARIILPFERIQNRIRIFLLYILLIRHGAGRQVRHAVARQKFPFGIGRFGAIDGSQRISADRIFF